MSFLKNEKYMRNYFLPKLNPAFSNDLNAKIERIITICSDLSQKIPEPYKIRLEALIAQINESKVLLMQFLVGSRSRTEQGAVSLNQIQINTTSFLQEAESLLSIYLVQSSDAPILQLNSIGIKWSTETHSLIALGSKGFYPHWVLTLFGFGFVFVPFLNILSVVLAVFQLTLKDWRGRVFGFITLVCFLLQSLSVFKMAG